VDCEKEEVACENEEVACEKVLCAVRALIWPHNMNQQDAVFTINLF
jgi:hypothetical protein